MHWTARTLSYNFFFCRYDKLAPTLEPTSGEIYSTYRLLIEQTASSTVHTRGTINCEQNDRSSSDESATSPSPPQHAETEAIMGRERLLEGGLLECIFCSVLRPQIVPSSAASLHELNALQPPHPQICP